jgi:hypothetical protein
MNKKIVTVGHPRTERVQVRTARGEVLFRRMWGGIAWPELPNPGAICIVGEIFPDKENVELDQLVLLDWEKGKTIQDLLKKTIDLKDNHCARQFFADAETKHG